jgi:hypothetical protein
MEHGEQSPGGDMIYACHQTTTVLFLAGVWQARGFLGLRRTVNGQTRKPSQSVPRLNEYEYEILGE